MREVSRTERYEALQEEARVLRQKAIDTKTLARSYSDLAEAIAAIPTRGSIWDIAQNDLVKKATTRAEQCSVLAAKHEESANEIETRGLD
jgi:hypothetical protein